MIADLPTPVVPRDWKRNKPIRITIEIGTTNRLRKGVATSNPSTALITEMAGVIIPSA